MEQVKDVTFTKEDAMKEADKVLGDLSIKGFAVGGCVKAIGDTDSESWAGGETDGFSNSTGYAVYLSPKAGDVTGYPLTLAAKPYEKLADHLLYTRVASLGGINPEGFAYTYTVKNVKLRAANINAYEDPEAAWLVPVWVFDVECEETYKTTEKTEKTKMGPETVVLNAIDGGFVQVRFDW